MSVSRFSVPLVLGVALAAALSLSGCGRKGPLDPPPSAAIPPPPSGPAVSSVPGAPGNNSVEAAQAEQANAIKNGFDAQGNPVAPPGQRKSFILDPLLQ